MPGAMVLSFANATKSGLWISQRGNELRLPCRIGRVRRRARVAKLSPSRVMTRAGIGKAFGVPQVDGCGSVCTGARLAREVC